MHLPPRPIHAPLSPHPHKQLADEKSLDMSHVRHFVVDECDKCLENIDMRADVQVRAAGGLYGTTAAGRLGGLAFGAT